MIKEKQIVDLLRKVVLFQDTPDSVLEELSSHILTQDYQPGSAIITKGEEGDLLYIIASGQVKVHDEKEVIATLKEGNFFGEISLLDSAPRSMSVTADGEVELYALSREDFFKVFWKQPDVMKIVISTLTRRLRRQNENTIQQIIAKERAEEAKRFEEQFLANMSHEIRTPMNAVIGMTNLLLKNTSPSEQQLKYLKAIKTSSENLLTILNDILDLSKIQAGKIELEEITFSLPEVLETVYQTLRFKAEEKGLFLKLDKQGEGYDYLLGDPVRLNQILINLAGNAIKFTEKGGVTIACHNIESSGDTVLLKFDVIDTGIGIPENKLDKIFESFSQASEETTRKYGGTGLGLTISKQLIEIKGGSIKVTSELGKGTTFSVTLPYKLSSRQVETTENITDNQEVIQQVSGLSILLAEDNSFNQIVAVDTLESLAPGIHVEIANNGKEAVEKLRVKDYDLVLMDIQMPEMNGYEAARFIRSQFEAPKKNIPIVAMTAGVTHTEKEKCSEAGMDHYLSKPFRPEELLAKLASIAKSINKVSPTPTAGATAAKPKFTMAESVATTVKMTDMTFLNNFTRGDKQKMAKYINMFLEICPQQLETMTNELKAGQYDRLRGAAHALKPQITYMGIHSGEDLIKKIEKYAEERREVENLPKMLDEFTSICNKAIPELKQIVTEVA